MLVNVDVFNRLIIFVILMLHVKYFVNSYPTGQSDVKQNAINDVRQKNQMTDFHQKKELPPYLVGESDLILPAVQNQEISADSKSSRNSDDFKRSENPSHHSSIYGLRYRHLYGKRSDKMNTVNFKLDDDDFKRSEDPPYSIYDLRYRHNYGKRSDKMSTENLETSIRRAVEKIVQAYLNGLLRDKKPIATQEWPLPDLYQDSKELMEQEEKPQKKRVMPMSFLHRYDKDSVKDKKSMKQLIKQSNQYIVRIPGFKKSAPPRKSSFWITGKKEMM